MYASVNGLSYFSCVSSGKRLVFSTESSTITKVTTVDERTDATLEGVVPVPGPNGGASTWALANSTQPGGFYGLMMSGAWEDQQAASKKAGIIGGVCAAIAVLLGVAGLFYWRRKKQQREARKVEESQHPDAKLEPLDGDTPPPGGNEANGFSAAPILESPLLSLPPGSQGQPQPQQFPQPYPQQFTINPPNNLFNNSLISSLNSTLNNTHSRTRSSYSRSKFLNKVPTPSIPSTLSQAFTASTQPYYQQQPSPSITTTSTPTAITNAPSFNANANSAQQLQDIQFSTHPRPNVTSQNVNATSTSTPDQPPVGQL
ncbi:MAG: hypothetical protein JOS17DRAFT_845456 [Linnemannia elongata]|nr:MAG: hypothetical protein JOS17DRAFT_845456 [Linnemannia elongata]